MFKRLFLFTTVFVTAFACVAKETTQSETTRAEVTAAFEALVKAHKSLDSDAYLSLFDTQRFVGLGADGTVWQSMDAIKQLVVPGFTAVKQIKHLHFPVVKISVIDKNTAVLINEYEQTAELQDGTIIEDAGGGTQVWSKHTGQWKLVSVSASAKPRR